MNRLYAMKAGHVHQFTETTLHQASACESLTGQFPSEMNGVFPFQMNVPEHQKKSRDQCSELAKQGKQHFYPTGMNSHMRMRKPLLATKLAERVATEWPFFCYGEIDA